MSRDCHMGNTTAAIAVDISRRNVICECVYLLADWQVGLVMSMRRTRRAAERERCQLLW